MEFLIKNKILYNLKIEKEKGGYYISLMKGGKIGYIFLSSKEVENNLGKTKVYLEPIEMYKNYIGFDFSEEKFGALEISNYEYATLFIHKDIFEGVRKEIEILVLKEFIPYSIESKTYNCCANKINYVVLTKFNSKFFDIIRIFDSDKVKVSNHFLRISANSCGFTSELNKWNTSIMLYF